MRTSQKVGLVSLLVLAAVARADDAVFKWNAFERREPRAGTKFTEELTKSDKRTLKFAIEGKAKEETHEGKEEIRLVHAVASVSSNGITEDRITFEKWSRAWDTVIDTSLEGAVVTVKGEGPFRTSATDSERPVSRAANAWLQSHVLKDGKKDPLLDELEWDFILPKDPVVEGGTWTIDPAAFAREVMGPQASIDAKRSSGTGKLERVKTENGVRFGHVEVTVSLALETLGPSKVAWKKGGIQEFRYVLDLSLEPKRKDLVAGVITMELSGEGTVEPPGQDLIDVDLVEKSRLEVRRRPVE